MTVATVKSSAVRWRSEVEAACADRDPSAQEIVALLRCCPPGTWGRIAAVVDVTGRSYGSVSSLAWVADHVVVEDRAASVAHLFAVGHLPLDQQRRRLEEAAAERLSGAALRRRIDEERGR